MHPKIIEECPDLGIIIGDGPWVYFLIDGLEMYSPIKIGHTGRPPKHGVFERVGETKSHSPKHLIAALPGGEITEKKLHKLFARDRMDGEWFRQTSDLLYLIHIMIQEAGARKIEFGQYVCIKMMEGAVDYWLRKTRNELNFESREMSKFKECHNDPFFQRDFFNQVYGYQAFIMEFFEPKFN